MRRVISAVVKREEASEVVSGWLWLMMEGEEKLDCLICWSQADRAGLGFSITVAVPLYGRSGGSKRG